MIASQRSQRVAGNCLRYGRTHDYLLGNLTCPQITEILALLQGAQEQWSSHTEQQTDSIRYLNELNTVSCPVALRPLPSDLLYSG